LDTLDRLLLKEFFTFFLAILFGAAVVYLGVEFFSQIWSLKVPASQIFILYVCKLPNALQLFVPVACLMATLLVLTNMSRMNEVLALYSSGVSSLRLVSTFIAAVATVSTAAFLVFDPLVPALKKKIQLIEKGVDVSQENWHSNPRGGYWYRSKHLIYNFGRFDPTTNTIEDLNVYQLDPQFQLVEKTHAKTARFETDHWVLRDGFRLHYPAVNSFPSGAEFKELTGNLPERPTDFKTIKIQEEMMRLRDLRRYITRNTGYGLDTTQQRVHYHERIAMVFTPLIFILIGIPFGLQPLRRPSMARSIALCFLVIFVYLMIFRLSISIGQGGHIPPLIAGWAPNMLFVGGWVIWYLRRKLHAHHY